jgi:hypothetical protein
MSPRKESSADERSIAPEVDPEAFPGTRADMHRAIRRLNALEWILLLAAVVMALGGGALVAWILSTGSDLSFRATWAVLSVILLVAPGILVFLRGRRR